MVGLEHTQHFSHDITARIDDDDGTIVGKPFPAARCSVLRGILRVLFLFLGAL